MCGIAGFWGGERVEQAVAERMAIEMRTRGPDDAGAWIDKNSGIALSHRRLSILDLSPAGHQPMISSCGRYVLVYNGEIYNYLDIRKDLDAEIGACSWKGHSDTETLLAAIQRWGIQRTLDRLNGMFAFAVWDAQEKVLLIARDRMGEKPLYYGRCGNVFMFGSELKALTAHPEWQAKVDRNALALYMRHNYVPAPWSIYQGISKLPPAHYVIIQEGGRHVGEPRCYWDLGRIAERSVSDVINDTQQLTDELDGLLRDAIGLRMLADVPLGAFLSGGIDSTTVVAQMQAQSLQPVRTFSIGFHESAYNEAQHASTIARYLGTQHTELYVTPEEAMAVIPMLPGIYDEPFSDSSQIPTYLVSKLAKQHVSVSLSGDGGDELFYGYERYFKGQFMWGKLGRLPFPLRRMAAGLLSRLPGGLLEKGMSLLPKKMRINHLEDRLPKLAEIISQPNGIAFYRDLVSHWKTPDQVVIGAHEPLTILSGSCKLPSLPGFRETMMYLDMMTYLPDDILAKVDRASMAVSLESRIPLLDHRVVEFAWKVNSNLKCRHKQGKWLLRQVLNRYVPEQLMDRPKMGFGVPIDTWLLGPLREWAEELLNEKRLSEEGFFNPEPIRRLWKEHVSGVRRWHYYLWDVLMFQAWHEGKKLS